MSQQSSSQSSKELSATASKNGGPDAGDKGFAALKEGLIKDSGQLTGGLKDLASGVASDAKQAVEGQLDSQKGRVVEGLDGVADALRRVSASGNKHEGTAIAPTLVPYIEEAADRVERASAYFDRKSLGEVARDVEDFARREPAFFLGGAFALGLLGGRFLKASQPASASYGSSYGQSRDRNRGRGSRERNERLMGGSQGQTRNGNDQDRGNGRNQYDNGNDQDRGNGRNQYGSESSQRQGGGVGGQGADGKGSKDAKGQSIASPSYGTPQGTSRSASDEKTYLGTGVDGASRDKGATTAPNATSGQPTDGGAEGRNGGYKPVGS